MEPRQYTLGRWLRDVAVTIVLLFTGIAVAGALTMVIAPQSIAVYMTAMLVSLIPTGIWLRHCNVPAFGTRAEFVTYLVLAVGYGIFIDVLAQAQREYAWLGFIAIMVARPWVQRLVEKSPTLAGRTPEAGS
jgi:hypothetical protein